MGLVTLMTSTNYNSLGNDINIVGTFSADISSKLVDKYVSPPLLNYVEPYEYQGVEKTLFYTEVNTNIKAGERVFIINGTYDSAEKIKADKYKKGTDGYKVLFVDRCMIVLDIDYTGDFPNAGDTQANELISDYIRVYYLDSYDTFVTANKQLTSRGGYIGSRFDFHQNNIAFIDNDYPEINDGWTRTTGVTASPGFYVREPGYDPLFVYPFYDGKTWYSITDKLMSGSFSIASSDTNPKLGLRFFNNQKMMVMERDFTYKGQEFKAWNTYVYNSTTGEWTADVKQQSKTSGAIITRGNFREGNFSGTFNNGVFGSKAKKISWTGDGKWNGGTLFNTSWVSGSMFSRISLEQSYKTSIGRDRKPFQRLNTFNNGGYGFNYIIESEFEATSIYSAIVRNTRFGMTPSLPVVENYITGTDTTFEKTITNGLFESCEFSNTKLIGGAVKNSRSRNTMMTGVKHINSWSKDVVIEKSTIIADSIIKIDGYAEWSAAERRNSQTFGAEKSDALDFKVYKFYIGEADYFKLKSKDSFYIKGLKIANDSELLNFFDKKFTLGSWTEYVDDYNSTGGIIGDIGVDFFYKKGIKCAAFLTTQEENEWIYGSVRVEEAQSDGSKKNKGYITDTIIENPNPQYSIDIFVSTTDVYGRDVQGINFNSSTASVSSLDYLPLRDTAKKIDVTTAYIIDSNIESGIIDSSNWNSGFNIEYNRDLIITKNLNDVDVMYYDVIPDKINGLITVKTQGSFNDIEIVDRYSKFLEPDIKTGDILFISALDYYSKGKVIEFTISSTGSYYPNNSSIPTGMSYSNLADYTDGFGLLVEYVSDGQGITSFTISSPGLDYRVGDVLYLNLPGQGSRNSAGNGIDASITITKVDTTESVRLADSWKVLQYNPPTVVLQPLYGSELIKGLTDSGLFMSRAAKNRWYGFGRTKISSSMLKSGMFKRSHLKNNTIENDNYDATDKDFLNMEKVKSLVLSDIPFSDTGNYMSFATYHNSSIVGGTDTWNDGIIYKSVLNNLVFNKGIIKQSSWLNGTFNGGLLYKSNSYDANPTTGKELYNQDRILSHYKGGSTLGKGANDRYSWRKGIFNGGDFFKSDWEFGRFNGGNFYGSKWYDGIANGGIFGNETTATNDTVFYSGIVNNTTVNNARFVTDDTSKTGIKNSITWNNGTFNGGLFGSITNKLITQANVVKETWPTNYSTSIYKFSITTKTITVPLNIPKASSFITDITDINVRVDFSATPVLMVRNLEIRLVAPNGRKVVMKEVGYGEGNELKSTIFSSDKSQVEMRNGSSPYQGKFSMAYGTHFGFANGNDTDITSVVDMVHPTDHISGVWNLEIQSSTVIDLPLVEIDTINAKIGFSIEFIPKVLFTTTVENSAVWNDGTFNGGQFIDYGIWKSGKFNGGKFLSTYGWSISGHPLNYQPAETHSWQGGEFNGGEFGNSSTGANSTWFGGEFNDGTFNGRIWKSGVFRYGTFNGSGATAFGGWNLATVATGSYADNFVESFTTDFYGLWKNGTVTDAKDVYANNNQTNQLGNDQIRETNQTTETKYAVLNNILWVNGQFDNNVGYLNNSVWLNGQFKKGYFTDGSFNPYVNRKLSIPSINARKFNSDTEWIDGTFVSGDFYFSKWSRGTFISGTALGMWFVDGTSYYMNAYNVTWGGTASYPVWKNGNWYGSEFDYLGVITNPLHKDIIDNTHNRNIKLNNGTMYGNSTRLHIWNVFEDLSASPVSIFGISADAIQTAFDFVPIADTQIFYPPVIW